MPTLKGPSSFSFNGVHYENEGGYVYDVPHEGLAAAVDHGFEVVPDPEQKVAKPKLTKPAKGSKEAADEA